ncbi:hypothetical protein CBR_g8297 [Chara braunii]|uniref:Uncharacterized protein n=1 Tax=Chara braunii TaxID=69332 RepID=A0A388KLX5_CHABU|nr:hypothetical protein CBR_g8297 [Chara braunii]|eukprot:GBG70998.1 hypothetical protein CBR_g8297 [Chara braunii]
MKAGWFPAGFATPELKAGSLMAEDESNLVCRRKMAMAAAAPTWATAAAAPRTRVAAASIGGSLEEAAASSRQATSPGDPQVRASAEGAQEPFWVFNGEYWSVREKRAWHGCPDIM